MDEKYTLGEKMKIRILKHNITMKVEKFDEKTEVATVKFFGTMQDFRKDEYKIVKEKR